jgi:hypothetical protein
MMNVSQSQRTFVNGDGRDSSRPENTSNELLSETADADANCVNIGTDGGVNLFTNISISPTKSNSSILNLNRFFRVNGED